jgi:uncharacterized membrane protein YkoI
MNERVVFIGVIVVLVAVLGLAGGYILFKNNPQTTLTDVNNSTSGNNSTSSGSNSPQTTSQSSNNSGNNNGGYISASQAMSIANSILEGHNLKATGATLIQSNPHPYYKVSLYDTKNNIYGGTVNIDAITGEQIE